MAWVSEAGPNAFTSAVVQELDKSELRPPIHIPCPVKASNVVE